MIQVLNNFLNAFENFCWRSLIVIAFLIAIPFISILFMFGYFDLTVTKEETKPENYEE